MRSLRCAPVLLTELLGLEVIDASTSAVTVTERLCSGLGTLFGGCAMAFAVDTARRCTDRPLVWATAQFVSQARPGDRLTFRAELLAGGRRASQVRVVGSADGPGGGREVVTVLAALGAREHPEDRTWVTPPEVGPPDAYPDRPARFVDRETVQSWLTSRLAIGRPVFGEGTPRPDGRTALWMRVPDGADADAAFLAVLGDFVPFGVWQAIEARVEVTSLDNTLRLVQLEPTRWVLADIRIHSVHQGFGHGDTFLWSESGTLLAVASQTTQVRAWPEDRPVRS